MRLFIQAIMILVLMNFLSCQTISQVTNNNSCDQDLKVFINDFWVYDTNGLVILIQEETEKFCSDMLPENKCLEGKNKEEIKRLFGEPHQVRLNKFMYYTIGTCFTENSEYCMYIHFDFDENGVYQTIGVSGWFKSN